MHVNGLTGWAKSPGARSDETVFMRRDLARAGGRAGGPSSPSHMLRVVKTD
jgi:hypothetical protein